MQIGRITVRNFRCLEEISVNLGSLTSLVGANNTGKSTILKAIDIFFQSSPKISIEDHFRHDLTKKISILIEFINLTPRERDQFASAVFDGKLRVQRELSADGTEGSEYSVYAAVHPGFQAYRDETNGTKRRSIYAELRKAYGLPAASSEEMDAQLAEWEAQHPEALVVMPVRGFFGARNVAAGKLSAKTSVRLVPAVKETGEELRDPRKSPLIGILSDIVRQTFENKAEYVDFLEKANQKIAELTDPASVPQLAGISDRITEVLSSYYSDTSLVATLDKANDLTVTFPAPVVNIEHRGLKVDVSHVGHGLQRAVFVSLVHFLAERAASSTEQDDAGEVEKFEEAQSDIILLVEEPEIYQHPIKQSLFFNAFSKIVKNFNEESGIRVQIIYTTHSEKMVDIRYVDQIRILSRPAIGDEATRCRSLSMEDFCTAIAGYLGVQPMPITQFIVGLHIFSREVSEAFFADKVILVEGVSDKAIIEAAFLAKDIDIIAKGIAVIDVGGKTKLDKPLFVLRHFEIPTLVVFDNDVNAKGKDAEHAKRRNRLLQRICGVEPEKLQDYPVGSFEGGVVLEGNLETYVKTCLEDKFDTVRERCADMYGISVGDTCKSPSVVSGIFQIGISEGKSFPLFDEIVDTVMAM